MELKPQFGLFPGGDLLLFAVMQIKKEDNSAGDHDAAQYLSHGERYEDKSEVRIGLAEIFDDKSYPAVAYEIKCDHRPLGQL